MEGTIRNIAVVGLGLVGASFAAAYCKHNPDALVLGVDISPRTREKAIEADWVTQAIGPDDPVFEAYVTGDCDLVMLATPVDASAVYLQKLATWGYENIITDTASTKMRISTMAQEILPHPERFVPGHPMAGSEKNGIDGAHSALFEGAYWILCPDEHTPYDYFPLMHRMLNSIGARVINLPCEKHDAAVAIVSHVPHLVASSLVRLASNHADERGELFRLAAGGFKDSTRIAAGSPQLWCGILFDNAEEVQANLDELKGIIDDFERCLATGDRAGLVDLLSASADARRKLPATWVPDSGRLFEAKIPMKNKQGAVAEIVTCASRLGCNIQSIDIDHITEDTAVLSLVLTDEGDRDGLAVELTKTGYEVSIDPLSAKEYEHVEQ